MAEATRNKKFALAIFIPTLMIVAILAGIKFSRQYANPDKDLIAECLRKDDQCGQMSKMAYKAVAAIYTGLPVAVLISDFHPPEFKVVAGRRPYSSFEPDTLPCMDRYGLRYVHPPLPLRMDGGGVQLVWCETAGIITTIGLFWYDNTTQIQ